MKRLYLASLALLTTLNAHAALAELNVAAGTIESPDGRFTGRDFVVADGFKIELLHLPPTTDGQWVALTWDNKNRLIVPSYNSDRMTRLTIPAVGSNAPVLSESINTTRVGAAEGILYAFDSLFMNVNRSNTLRAGLYRLRDTNGDDKYDETRVIRNRQGDASDHGTHTLQLTPDGKWISVISGNATRMTEFDMSRVPSIYGEDVLIDRLQFSPPGFHRAPDAHVENFSPDGAHVELFAIGMRNPVSHAFNKDGEMFVYDADEEPNIGYEPGYQPTDVLHVISGGDTGWRSGSRVHPGYYFDNFGRIAIVGRGSPVGSGFGTGAKFPARYQDAFYIADWSYGNLWAVMLTPDGGSYKAAVTPFISGRPFAVSGVAVNKADGSLIVMTTGTELYRITYVGSESTAPTKPDTRYAAVRDQRHELEKYHGKKDAGAVAAAWPFLGDADASVRYAARTAVEWQDPALWREKALTESDPRRATAAIAALARVSAPDKYHENPATPATRDKALENRMLATLDRISWPALDYQEKLDLLRAYQLVLIRLGQPDEAARQRLIARFDPYLPATQQELNMMLSELLIYLQAPSAASKVMALLRSAPSERYFGIQEWPNPEGRTRGSPGSTGPEGRTQSGLARQSDQEHYAELLRALKAGWTPELRREYLTWFVTAPKDWTGAVAGALGSLRLDAVSQIPAAERAQYQELIDTPIPSGGNAGARGGAVAAAPAGGGGGRGGAQGTPGMAAPETNLYVPVGGANRAFNDLELTALTRFDESMEKEITAQAKASTDLVAASLSLPVNPATIQARANALATAEIALAQARAAGLGKLKADLKLAEEKVPALIQSIAVKGGRGVFIGGQAGGALGGGIVVPAGGRGN
jgi:hypothetical protein